MYNSSLRIVGATVVAEDIMQESFLTAFRKLSAYSGEVSFGAWLKKIVINRSLDYLRKRKVVFEELQNDLQITDEEEPEFDQMTVAEIKTAISALPDGYRTIFLLIEVEGYKHREVAEMLNISEGTSKSQLYYAKRLLKEKLKKEYL